MPSSPSDQDTRHQPRPTRGMPAWLVVIVRQLGFFAGIGAVMTVAYLSLYALLRGPMGPQSANVVAWVATAIVNSAANRRVTFGISGRAGALRAQVEGMMIFGLGLGITSGSLLALEAVRPASSERLEVGVLAAANLVAGSLRFALLRWWVFAPGRARG